MLDCALNAPLQYPVGKYLFSQVKRKVKIFNVTSGMFKVNVRDKRATSAYIFVVNFESIP